MSLKTLIVAAICVAPILPAYAADQSIDLSSGVASFTATAPILAGGDDLITFTGLAPGLYDFVFSLSSQHIGALAASVNSQPALTQTVGPVTFAGSVGTSNSPFSVLLQGLPLTAGATYSGELSVTSVPEPGSLALMLAGIAAVGLLMRRRRMD